MAETEISPAIAFSATRFDLAQAEAERTSSGSPSQAKRELAGVPTARALIDHAADRVWIVRALDAVQNHLGDRQLAKFGFRSRLEIDGARQAFHFGALDAALHQRLRVGRLARGVLVGIGGRQLFLVRLEALNNLGRRWREDLLLRRILFAQVHGGRDDHQFGISLGGLGHWRVDRHVALAAAIDDLAGPARHIDDVERCAVGHQRALGDDVGRR